MIVRKKIRFLDLSINDDSERSELELIFRSHLDSGMFILGDNVSQFEEQFSKAIYRKHAVGVNTGTDALLLGIKALSLPAGSTVITTPFSWLASASTLCMNDLRIKFVDVGEDLNLDAEQVEQAISSDTSAILAVHMHGNMCDMNRLKQISDKYKIKLIEDCAQSAFSHDEFGRKAGSYGHVSAFSFNPMKSLAALGDAGAIVFDDDSYLARLKGLRHSGVANDGILASELSHNCRIDSIQAGFLNVRMKYLAAKISRRRVLYNLYESLLPKEIRILKPREGCIPNHYVLQTICPKRDNLKEYLYNQGIETKIRHPFLIQDHPAIKFFATGETPYARTILNNILCLPMHDNLTEKDVGYVANYVQQYYS
jgi:dTDP-4-amino-4,6-dideoxygalactose transaminase